MLDVADSGGKHSSRLPVVARRSLSMAAGLGSTSASPSARARGELTAIPFDRAYEEVLPLPRSIRILVASEQTSASVTREAPARGDLGPVRRQRQAARCCFCRASGCWFAHKAITGVRYPGPHHSAPIPRRSGPPAWERASGRTVVTHEKGEVREPSCDAAADSSPRRTSAPGHAGNAEMPEALAAQTESVNGGNLAQ